jgi:hypothetical protein
MRKREVTMLNITSQGANLSPFAKMLNITSQGANKPMPDAFVQRLYSSEQRWEGIIAEVQQTCFPREPLPVHFMQRANSTLLLTLQGVADIQRQSNGRTEQQRYYKGSITLEPPEASPTYFFPQRTSEPRVVLSLDFAPSLFEQTVAETGRNDPTHVEIVKQFNLHDPLIEQIGLALVSELEAGGVAGRLYAESLGLIRK